MRREAGLWGLLYKGSVGGQFSSCPCSRMMGNFYFFLF